MGEVSYQFSDLCDLGFEADVLSVVSLNIIVFFAGRQYNFRIGNGSIKCEISIFLVHDWFDFEKTECGTNICRNRIATDVVDILHDSYWCHAEIFW
jgi:hypothetical protein